MTIAIYPGSFDPITNGHLDIARRAAKLFDKLIIAVYDTPPKNLLFTTEERLKLAKLAVAEADLLNVEVQAFSGLVVDFAKKVRADVMVRGLRVNADFEREFEMALMNKKLNPDLELVCLMTSQNYQFLSSSLLKEVVELGGNTNDMVPEAVLRALKEKFKQRRKSAQQ